MKKQIITSIQRRIKEKRDVILFSVIIVTIIGVMLFIYMPVGDKSINDITSYNIENPVNEQNEDSPSYFFVLTPDNMGNLMIDTDVVDYKNDSGYVMGIIQTNPYAQKRQVQNNTIYDKVIYPNLVYLQYGSKIIKYSQNDRYYNVINTFNFETDFDRTYPFTNFSRTMQNIRLKYVPNNISDFKLSIYASDEYAESYPNRYPFDSIKSLLMFEFPDKTNINIIIKIPDELKDYNVTPMVTSVNKTTLKKENESAVLNKSMYDRVYRVSTTKSIDMQDNYILVTINMERPPLSIEKISIILLLIISLVFLIGVWKASTINWEHVSLYIAVFSILISNYLAKKPITDSTIYFDSIIPIVIIILIVAVIIKWSIGRRKISTHKDFDPPL